MAAQRIEKIKNRIGTFLPNLIANSASFAIPFEQAYAKSFKDVLLGPHLDFYFALELDTDEIDRENNPRFQRLASVGKTTTKVYDLSKNNYKIGNAAELSYSEETLSAFLTRQFSLPVSQFAFDVAGFDNIEHSEYVQFYHYDSNKDLHIFCLWCKPQQYGTQTKLNGLKLWFFIHGIDECKEEEKTFRQNLMQEIGSYSQTKLLVNSCYAILIPQRFKTFETQAESFLLKHLNLNQHKTLLEQASALFNQIMALRLIAAKQFQLVIPVLLHIMQLELLQISQTRLVHKEFRAFYGLFRDFLADEEIKKVSANTFKNTLHFAVEPSLSTITSVAHYMELAGFWASIYQQIIAHNHEKYPDITAPVIEKSVYLFEKQIADGDLSRTKRILWLCGKICQVIQHRDRQLDDRDQQLIESLSFVALECCRYDAYKGAKVKFMTQPIIFADHLLNLIHFYCETVIKIKLPVTLLNLLRQSFEEKEAFGFLLHTEYLQHTLDLFLLGCILNHEHVFPPKGAGPAVDKRLGAWLNRNSQTTSSEVNFAEHCQVFALGALFHDIGILEAEKKNSPDYQRHSDPASIANLKKLGIISEKELLLFDHYFNHTIHGHALYAANKLVEEFESFSNLQRATTISRKTVFIPAVRSILFHSFKQKDIRVEQSGDPAAALLILCDCIFEWLPSAHIIKSPRSKYYDDVSFTLPIEPFENEFKKLTLQQPKNGASGKGKGKGNKKRFLLEMQQMDFEKRMAAVFLIAQSLGRLTTDEYWEPEIHIKTTAEIFNEDLRQLEQLAVRTHHDAIPYVLTLIDTLRDANTKQQKSPQNKNETKFIIEAGGSPFKNYQIEDCLEAIFTVKKKQQNRLT